MTAFETIRSFYVTHLPNAKLVGHTLSAACPFCQAGDGTQEKSGNVAIHLNPASYFRGYFRCSNHCVFPGYHVYFGHLMGLDPATIPGVDPEVDAYTTAINYPLHNLNAEIQGFVNLMKARQVEFFEQYGISETTLKRMRIGYNGRYFVYPYFQENGHAYSAHCLFPARREDQFWHGNQDFSKGDFRIFNMQEIDRCDGGALFMVEGEINLLILKELGYPAVAVPSATDWENLKAERFDGIQNLFILARNSPGSRTAAREFATRLGFKARILSWPAQVKRGQDLTDVASERKQAASEMVAAMIKSSRAHSPFVTPLKEHQRVLGDLSRLKGRGLLGLPTGFDKLDRAVDGLRGINIMGGPPKAGKSTFFMQISTNMALREIPVIYYDFENGRRTIYLRSLLRLSRLTDQKLRKGGMAAADKQTLEKSLGRLQAMLTYFTVVTDRKLNPEVMRRHIDFLKHETQKEEILIVIDSLHKLPFKDLSERRTGIDSWLRNLEAIRDEQNVCFLVISELSRGNSGGYDERPSLTSFKETGDIEYSADNAMVLMPQWSLLDSDMAQDRHSDLWVVASRENNPGLVATYRLDYPFWRFEEG